jgi:hypothetical protein
LVERFFAWIQWHRRILVCWKYCDATNRPYCIFISGQKRGVFGATKREQGRRSAIEP